MAAGSRLDGGCAGNVGCAASMRAVAHVVECYLGLTETFIHEYLAAFQGVTPVVIARRLENLDLFPLPPGVRPVTRRWPPYE